MRALLAPALLLAAALASGCTGLTGLPEGAADFGDTVTILYTATLDNGTRVIENRTTSFILGTGASGLGLDFERRLRGHEAGANVSVTVRDDASLKYGSSATAPREIPSMQRNQSTNRAGLEEDLGPASVGMTFRAYGVYTARVTSVSQDRVNFTIEVEGEQRDDLPAVGAVLVSRISGGQVTRRLDPDEGATFTIAPPSFRNPQTPLGLAAGSYRTEGATDTAIVYSYSNAADSALLGATVRYEATILRLQAGEERGIEPVDGNYAARRSPHLNGDAESFLGRDDAGTDHAH